MKTLLIKAALITTLLVAGSLVIKDDGIPDEKRAELVIREVGHRLLLQSGDSTSRVMPVKKISQHTFRLEFEQSLAFVPDSLARIIHQRFLHAGLPPDYRVSVSECRAPRMIFGYEMNRKGDVLPCFGRNQPEGCYVIDIEFLKKPELLHTGNVAALVLISLVISFVAFYNRNTPLAPEKDNGIKQTIRGIKLGAYVFDPDRKILQGPDNAVELSDKETIVLRIFALRQNQVIERDLLLKEAWEDQGIFVIGRSLDVFVSKLRKKLSGDPSLRIVNVHGKGYKLEVQE